FDAAGAIRWSVPATGPTIFPTCAPMVDADGNVYTASYGTAVSADPTGATRWTSTMVGANSGDLALGTDGSILVPNYSTGYATDPIVALDPATGAVRWKTPLGGNLQTSPIVDASGWIYYVADGGTLYALDGAGNMQWSLVLPTGITGSPVLGANQTLYLAGTDAKLYAVGP
ncbi:MAG TPA: PQQ-binding-like beta-propeller repeat protein, partial [Polyangia bacterium]|nr:PQQ-binding-like beta-propeller repeat protein [Polyangia bacterium]